MARATWSPECYKLLKRFNYQYQLVEHWLHFKGIQLRKDFGGFADILAWRPTSVREVLAELEGFSFGGVLAIQACSHSTLRAHLAKCTQGEPQELLSTFLLAGNRFEVWAFPEPRKKTRHTLYPVEDKNGRSRMVRQIDMHPLRVTFDDGQFSWTETTELSCFGYYARGKAA